MKPYAVSVTIGDKVSGKEFETEQEFNAFMKKAEELKQRASNLLVRVIRKPIEDKREGSLCWEPILKDGRRELDGFGRLLYQCVPAPTKPGVFYCPYCLTYKKWGTVHLDSELQVKGCLDCGMTVNDFYIKTANNLWKMKG